MITYSVPSEKLPKLVKNLIERRFRQTSGNFRRELDWVILTCDWVGISFAVIFQLNEKELKVRRTNRYGKGTEAAPGGR